MGAAMAHIGIAKLKLKQNKPGEMLSALTDAQQRNEQMTHHNQNYYRNLSYWNEAMGEYQRTYGSIDSAYHYQRKALQTYKSATYDTDHDELTEREVEYLIREEKQQSFFLKQQNKNLLIALVVGSLFLLVILGITYFYINSRRKIKRQNSLISVKNEELIKSLHLQDILLSEVHHRVKNNLQFLAGLLSLEDTTGSIKGKKIVDQLTRRIQSISIIHEQLYMQEEGNTINAQTYLSSLFKSYNNISGTVTNFNFSIFAEDIHLNIATMLPIGILCSELINNSLKHAHLPIDLVNVNVRITREGADHHFIYADNGIGIQREMTTSTI